MRIPSSSSSSSLSYGPETKADKKVVCYLSGWSKFRKGDGSFHVDKADPFMCTHIMYTFAGLDINGNIISLDFDNDVRDSKKQTPSKVCQFFLMRKVLILKLVVRKFL